MKVKIIYNKQTKVWTIHNGYMVYEADEAERNRFMAQCLFERDCSVVFLEDEEEKKWIIAR